MDDSPTFGDPRPLVTICVTAYRRPTTLVQALLSCVGQDYRPLDIDVGDDSPNDSAELAIRSVPVPPGVNLRYGRNAPSLGEPGNVNKLFRDARGSLILLLHDDDVLLPGAVSALAQALTAYPEAIAAFGLQQIIQSSGEVDPKATTDLNERYFRVSGNCGLIEDPLLSGLRRQFPNNGYLVRASAARDVGYRTVDKIGRAGDTDFGIRLGQAFAHRAFLLIPAWVSQYRLPSKGSRSNLGISWKLYDFLEQMTALTAIQAEARDHLLSAASSAALVDNAVNARRRRALQVFRTPGYIKTSSRLRKAYHVCLIMLPSLYRIRKYVRFFAEPNA